MLIDSTSSLTANMRQRGGGIFNIKLNDKSDLIEDYYQLHNFETVDSMGANFINSCLFATTLQTLAEEHKPFLNERLSIEVIMSILSNFTRLPSTG